MERVPRRPVSELVKDAYRRAGPLLDRAEPVVTAVERVARIAVHLRRPTPLGVVGAVSAGIAGLNSARQKNLAPRHPGEFVMMLFSAGELFAEFSRRNAHIRGNERTGFRVTCDGVALTIRPGTVTFDEGADAARVEWLRGIVASFLPRQVVLAPRYSNDRYTWESKPAEPCPFQTRTGRSIWDQTRPMLGNGRCILLTGKPGVGKSSLAREIAGMADVGRTVEIPNGFIGVDVEDAGSKKRCSSVDCAHVDGLRVLDPGVVIVDDVDKVAVHMPTLVMLRGACSLLILTANNGECDEVIDNAVGRPGRIDEVFTIEGEPRGREVPFDQLTRDEWDEVQSWPVAFLEEVRARLTHRPNEPRLDDLRQRVAKRTRSGRALR